MAKILLTGSTGMVGRNILEHPAAGMHQWICPSRQECNLTDYDAVLSCVRRERPDVVIHAAGRVGGIQANIANPVEFLVENTDIGRNVVMAAMTCEVPRLLNLGSSCMYPRDRSVALRESDILTGELEPTNEGYALAKIFAMRLCEYISKTQPALSYKTILPCNLYGRWDHFDPAAAHLVAAAIRKVHQARENGDQSVLIWGDGLARREFMYAGDLADFVMFALPNFARLPAVLNVGAGDDRTVNDYYHAVSATLGYSGAFVHDTTKPVGMMRKLMDSQRLAELGWAPRTSLDEGLRQTYRFFLEHAS